ncbi:MAG: DUF1598 domain-containing protein [Planctomycetota bacterium]|nr:MAG: DUF1598 domain-containing protein [Planctomycetota bacterium]
MNHQPPPTRRPERFLRGRSSLAIATMAVVLAFGTATGAAHAQGFLGGQAVGGISIDADGIVRNLDPKATEELAVIRRQALGKGGPVRGLKASDGLRKVSLARLAAAVEAAADGTAPLPTDVALMGGLERITHLFVDPDGHDIVLAGPADAARIDAAGNVLGADSGRPLLQLEDFIVALRAIDGAREGGMRCSIDPSPEGVGRLQQFLKGQQASAADPAGTLRKMEEVLGPQTVTVGGVPADSRFARVLVAADYRLKRIGMGLEPAGVPDLPSYLAMVPAGATAGTLPRFWLEASYDPIARDADELAFHISGRRMKCLTENDLFGKDGVKRGAGAVDKVAQKWCDTFTAKYDALAAKQPVFAELTNCVDLAVVAALIHGQQLDKRAGLDLSSLTDPTRVKLPTYEAPATVPTVASGVKKGGRWVVSASGGIQFQPWGFASLTNESADVSGVRSGALAGRPESGYWWD